MLTERWRLAILCNLLVPGSGLIVLRRDWLGLALALLFGVFGQVALWGTLIVPAVVPGWLTTGSLAAATGIWLGAQWQLWERAKVIAGPALQHELSILSRQAQQYASEGHYAKAEDILRLALSINDEDLACNLRWAELMTLLGKSSQARRAWHRVLHLDRKSQHRRQAQQALATLSG
ncbi:MAG: hypothetical protein ACE5GE_01005 [Phycisphaerae bacterium]